MAYVPRRDGRPLFGIRFLGLQLLVYLFSVSFGAARVGRSLKKKAPDTV